jgi:hypothetical protein
MISDNVTAGSEATAAQCEHARRDEGTQRAVERDGTQTFEAYHE